jgi:hypothetical protein
MFIKVEEQESCINKGNWLCYLLCSSIMEADLYGDCTLFYVYSRNLVYMCWSDAIMKVFSISVTL